MPVWIELIEWLARIILLGLVGLSVWSIAIIIDRRRFFKELSVSDFVKNLTSIADKHTGARVESALSVPFFHQKVAIEKGLSVLGTLGSTTPFIGLLGTILGIIVAFGELSMGKGDTNAIMFALAEALILTAVGLFVAIPAVIAFNIYKRKSRFYFDEVRASLDQYLSLRKDP